MAELSPEYPKIEPTDPESVVIALQRAHALLGVGDTPEAVRWIRRAAEQAEREGNDARAVQLARLAADFAVPLESAWRSSSLAPASDDEAAALAAFDDFSDQTTVDGPDAAVVREAFRSRVQIHEVDSVETDAAVPTTRSSPSSTPSNAAPTIRGPAVGVRSRQALRVAVRPTRDANGSFIVIPLADGVAAPMDTVEAMLVPLSADVDLLR